MPRFHRVKIREKMLEQALAKLAGENWQVSAAAVRWLSRMYQYAYPSEFT